MKVVFVHEENVLAQSGASNFSAMLLPSEVTTWFGMGSFRENLPHGSHGSGHDGTVSVCTTFYLA